jgi:hypothetical protein
MYCLDIFSVYVTEDCKPKEEEENFYEILDTHLNDVPADQAGDLNARVGNDPCVKQRFKEEATRKFVYKQWLTQ